jgi:hypothetical protein
MDFVHLPEPQDDTSTDAETAKAHDDNEQTKTDGVERRAKARASGGGDASNILPDEILEARIRSCGTFDHGDPSAAVTIRAEFAQLQRELEAKIARFDRTCDVWYEDSEVIVYRLERRKDYEYILDYCEVETDRLREILVALLRAIAADRADDAIRYPLVVRKPHMFRCGERHVIDRLSASNPTIPSE